MCSASDRERVRVAAIVAAMLFALAQGCDDRGGEGVAMNGMPPVSQPVGPVPGPPLEASPSVNPFGQDPLALNDGRLYFVRYNCSGCHGDHGGGGMGPSLRDDTWIYGSSDAQIFSDIAEGRAHGMPSWASRIPDAMVWRIVSYIKSLRTPDEPDPPDQTTPPPPDIR
jgi:cytochrome c oxidase cbb3-type subunit 3